MPEKIEELVRAALAAAQEAGDLSAFELDDCAIERPADTSHGEWTSTMALKSAKLAHCAPRKIAEVIVAHMPEDPAIEKVEIAGPGFINFYLSVAVKNAIFGEAREKGMDFAKSNVGGGLKTQVEFVSANPVGPMHIGHGRWAALGDSLCRVMDHAGYEIQREFYINDHGSQMNTFGNSISTRYMQLADIIAKQGVDIDEAHKLLIADRDAFVADENDEHPETHPYQDNFAETLGKDSYGGDYIIDEAAEFWRTDGDKWVDADPQERMESFRERGYVKMVDNMRDLCHAVNCDFDRWYSERSLYVKDTEGETAGTSAVDRAFEKLDKMGYLYTKDGALWFRSTDLGDDKDRVLIKSDGEYTYFASDVAYHWDKFQRVDHVIDIWGADHHGYIERVRCVCDALGYPGKFEVLLGQLVNLLRNGKPVRMSNPPEQIGRAISDIRAKSGSFDPPVETPGGTLLQGRAPVSELRDYARDVAAYTRGRGRLSCEVAGYFPCHNTEAVVAALAYDPAADLENTPDSVFCSHGAGYTVRWDEVEQHMHLESCLRAEKETTPAQESVPRGPSAPRTGAALDKELQAIYERTYGAVKQNRAFVPRSEREKPIPQPKAKPIPAGPEYLLVDGYNIIFAWDELKAVAADHLDAARQLLMDLLCNYQGVRQCRVILVFDAYRVPFHKEEIVAYNNIHVVYTKEAETADAYIEKTSHEIAKDHRVRVATSDGMEQLIVLGQGALRLSADSFHTEVMQAGEEIRETLRRLNRRERSDAVAEALRRAAENAGEK